MINWTIDGFLQRTYEKAFAKTRLPIIGNEIFDINLCEGEIKSYCQVCLKNINNQGKSGEKE
ncbi:MAG: hypothetical protein Q8N99_05880 [Nanoarchaeota archaeon]|nr:hypothetical protein [Nanoarchaeota archaeon]